MKNVKCYCIIDALLCATFALLFYVARKKIIDNPTLVDNMVTDSTSFRVEKCEDGEEGDDEEDITPAERNLSLEEQAMDIRPYHSEREREENGIIFIAMAQMQR